MRPPVKKLLFVLGALVVLGVVAHEAIPVIARREIQKRHPEVAFEAMDLGWSETTLSNVTIDKGWIVAHVTRARVNMRTNAVALMGGTVDVDLDKRTPGSHGGAPTKVQITADDLTVHVHGAGISATAEGFAAHDDYTAARASGLYKGQKLAAVDIVVPRDLSRVRVANLTFPEGVKIREELVQVTAQGLSMDPRSKVVDFDSIEADHTFHGQRGHVTTGPGHVRLDGEALALGFDQVRIEHPWVLRTSSATLREVSAQVPLSGDAFDLNVGKAKIHVDPRALSVAADESCETWLAAMPGEFRVGPLRGDVFRGGRLKFSVGLKPQPTFKISGQCSAVCASVHYLAGPFAYTAYDAKGQPVERISGPGSSNWTPIEQVHENVTIAVLNMEDFGFRFHHGFLTAALQNSFAIDVQAGKFERGGSTITMQTAKNLWLSREKTVGRKIEELLLSQVLEDCLTKDKILALYLNIVEFGPNLYGIRQAARRYFKTDPSTLEPAAAFYLAWILPRPRTAPPPDAATLERVKRIMKALAEQNRIPGTMVMDEPTATEGWEAP